MDNCGNGNETCAPVSLMIEIFNQDQGYSQLYKPDKRNGYAYFCLLSADTQFYL